LDSIPANNLGSPSTGVWYHVVVWHDSANNELGIQVNDAAPDTKFYSGGVRTSDSGFKIGATQLFAGGQTDHLNGRVASVGFWKNRVLSESDRNELFNGGVNLLHGDLNAGLLTSISAYFNLDELNGTRFDSVGSANLTDNNGVTRVLGPDASENTSYSSSST